METDQKKGPKPKIMLRFTIPNKSVLPPVNTNFVKASNIGQISNKNIKHNKINENNNVQSIQNNIKVNDTKNTKQLNKSQISLPGEIVTQEKESERHNAPPKKKQKKSITQYHMAYMGWIEKLRKKSPPIDTSFFRFSTEKEGVFCELCIAGGESG